MSADAATLPCPVCSHSGIFGTVEALRDKLISVSTNSILCPVCQEEVIGLDKLTIHLFSHVKVLAKTSNSDKVNIKNCDVSEKRQPKKSRPSQPAAKNKNSSLTSNTPVKFVKIYPKLPVISLNTVPIIEMSPEKNAEVYVQNKNSIYVSTVKTDVKLVSSDTTCTVCGLQFVDSHILKMHRCLIHNIDENSNQSCTRYNCHLCPKHFKMRGSLMVHLRVAHYGFSAAANNAEPNIDENTNIKSQNLDNVSVIIEKSDNKQWQCDVCRKCFTTKYFLKKHKRLHTGETPYACTQCNKTFTFQQSYHKHLLYHNDEKPHSCSYCGRAFKELSTLHNHQRIHTGEKPFSCETCGKCFRQRVSYLVHRRIHTGVMPYKCTACDKSFRYKVSQRTHKCQSQPPGTVVRQMGDLIEKLKQKHVETTPVSMEPENAKNGNQNSNAQITTIPDNYPEVSEANAELVRKGAELSLEDMESENFNIIADTFKENTELLPGTSDIVQTPAKLKDIDIYESNLDELINSIPVIEKNVPSPSEILKNLCLSSDEDLVGILQETDKIQHNDVSKEFNIFL